MNHVFQLHHLCIDAIRINATTLSIHSSIKWEWWPHSSDISHISPGSFWGWWSIANACCFVGLEWEMPDVPTVTVICILALIAGLQNSWKKGVPWVFTTTERRTRKTIMKPNVNRMNTRKKTKKHCFIPCHTNHLFCSWAFCLLKLFHYLVCVCWQSPYRDEHCKLA